MALPLGKLTILVGAGVIGSVLAQDGCISKVSDFFSGAFKIAFKNIQQDDSPSTGKSKMHNDALLAQVNSLRQELQLLASSRSMTVITASRSGATAYGMPVVVIGVVGYGYIWWKGWKLSDMMLATRHSLSDACTTVAKQLEQVHSSLSAAKKYLSSRIERVDKNLDECKKITDDTRDEVALLREDLSGVGVDVQSVHHVVQTLEMRIGRIEGKQDITNEGLYRLCEFAQNFDQGTNAEHIQTLPSTSSSPALEFPRIRLTSRTGSLLQGVPALESSSTSASSQTPKFLRPLETATSASGLKELQGISNMVNTPDPAASNGSLVAKEPSSSGPLSSERSGWKLPGLTASLLTRTRGSTNAFR